MQQANACRPIWTMEHQVQPQCHIGSFGKLPNGRTVEAIRLDNGLLRATILTWGATLQAMYVPDRHGELADVTAGFSSIEDYVAHNAYFGASIGRVANRIAGGRFVLDGVQYQVPVNNGVNALHGGNTGLDRLLWHIAEHGVDPTDGAAYVCLTITSPDGDQGFPGALSVTADWRLYADRLCVTYQATCNQPTVVNLTNHGYWNLGGESSDDDAMKHSLMIPADFYLPTDATAIPTGERCSVVGTPFDFTQPTPIGARIAADDAQLSLGQGYDHNWCLRPGISSTPHLACCLHEPVSGRTLSLYSDHPGLQFYSGNFLDGSLIGKSGQPYRHRSAIALEPQYYPDTPNQPAFGSLRLDPGETYNHAIEWHFSA